MDLCLLWKGVLSMGGGGWGWRGSIHCSWITVIALAAVSQQSVSNFSSFLHNDDTNFFSTLSPCSYELRLLSGSFYHFIVKVSVCNVVTFTVHYDSTYFLVYRSLKKESPGEVWTAMKRWDSNQRYLLYHVLNFLLCTRFRFINQSKLKWLGLDWLVLIWVGDFWVTLCLCFKGSPSAKPFMGQLVLFTRKWTTICMWIKLIFTWKARTHFETEAKCNSEIAVYWIESWQN